MKNVQQSSAFTATPQFIECETSLDVFSIFKLLEQHTARCFLFEAVAEHQNVQRYTVMGFDPDFMVSARGNSITLNGKTTEVENPYYFLRSLFPPQTEGNSHFTGGLVGYLGYDAVNYFEPELNIKTHPDFAQFDFGMYTDGLVYDNLTGQLAYFYHAKNRYSQVAEILSQPERDLNLKVTYLGDGLTQTEHSAGVQAIKSEVKLGNTFQSQFGFKKHYRFAGDALAAYAKLRTVSPAPYAFYFKHEKQVLLGASPELLFRLQDRHMETFPLAGTALRGRTQQEDQHYARELLSDPKEIAEHTMLVDLHRNDLGRVAEFGSVRLQKLQDVKKFSHVQHISSEVVGTLKHSEDMFSALASNFPAGTLSGAPKIESMKIINRLEKEPRGPYGGAVGYFGFDGNCQFCIPIRSLFIAGKKGFTQASGGIVYDSEPDAEYQEIQRKLHASDHVLSSFKETA